MSGIKRFARIGNFEGVFDGEGHAILNWKTDGGLFRLVAEGSVVRNLVIAESCSMKVSDDGGDALYAGFVADVNHGILERCENYGSIAHRSARSLHDNYVGGVCGMNKYVVIRCKNGGDISSAGSCPSLAPTAEPRMYLGGVLGGSLGRSLPGAFVAWCENTGRVGYSGAFIVSHIGGIVGYNMRVKTKFCINRGEIVSAARGVEEGSDRYCQEMAGGICGMAKGDVMCCDNFGSVTTRGHAYSLTAGICGSAHESLTVGDCDNFAPVTSTSTYQASVGGIVGLSGRPVVVSHCRNKGAVRFDGTSVDRRSTAGGIVGDIYAKRDAVYAASVRDCRNEGDVSCGLGENTRNSARGIQAAGIVGFINGNEAVSADVRDCVNTGRVRSESGRAAASAGSPATAISPATRISVLSKGAGRCWAASSRRSKTVPSGDAPTGATCSPDRKVRRAASPRRRGTAGTPASNPAATAAWSRVCSDWPGRSSAKAAPRATVSRRAASAEAWARRRRAAMRLRRLRPKTSTSSSPGATS